MKAGATVNQAARAYVVQFTLAMLAYCAAVIISVVILNAFPDAPWRAAVAVIPVVPAIAGLLVFLRFLGRMDELQRRIQLEAIGFSFGATGILTFTYGFLQNAGFPAINWICILPGMILLWGLGLLFAGRRYQ